MFTDKDQNRRQPARRGAPQSKPYKSRPNGRERFEDDGLLLEGKNAVQEALESGREIDKIFFAAGSLKTVGHLVARAREQGGTDRGVVGSHLGSASLHGCPSTTRRARSARP